MDLTAGAPAASRPAVSQLAARVGPAAGTAAALVLGLVLLARRPLSVEEALNVVAARDRLGDVYDTDPARAGYAALLEAASRIGDGEALLRLPSVAAAVLAAGLAYTLGSALLGRLGGVLASLLLAVNAAVVSVSQQARPLALALAAIALSTLLLVLALDRGRAWWIGYAAAALVLPVAHPLAASVLLAHGATIAVRRRDAAWRWAGPALGFVGVETALLVAAAAVDRSDAADASGGLASRELGRAILAAAGWSPLLLAAAVIGVTLLGADRVPEAEPWAAVLVGGIAAAPLLVTVVASAALPVYAEPALVLAAPGLALGAAAALVCLPSREAIAAAAVLLAVAALPVAAWYAAEPDEDWRAAARAVETRRTPSETVVAVPAAGAAALAYYAPGLRPVARARGSAAWVLVRATPDQAIDLARAAVPTPRYALLDQASYGDGLTLQRWVRP